LFFLVDHPFFEDTITIHPMCSHHTCAKSNQEGANSTMTNTNTEREPHAKLLELASTGVAGLMDQ